MREWCVGAVGGDLVQLHLLLIDHSNSSRPGSGCAGVFHTYRCKSCLTGLLLAVSSVPSLWLVKSLPLFARRDPGIVLVSAAACTVLVLLSHFPTCFRVFFSVPVLRDEDEQLSGKAQGLSFGKQIRVSCKHRRCINVSGCWYRPLPVESFRAILSAGWFHPWLCSALPVTDTRTVLHMSTSKWP